MVVHLPVVKESFADIVESMTHQPWTMVQFIIWLDIKLAEYKINGYMVLDRGHGSLPEWLSNLNVDQTVNEKGLENEPAIQDLNTLQTDLESSLQEHACADDDNNFRDKNLLSNSSEMGGKSLDSIVEESDENTSKVNEKGDGVVYSENMEMRDNLESLTEPQAEASKRPTIQGDELNCGKRRRVMDSVSPVAMPVKSSTHLSGISHDNVNRSSHLTELHGSNQEQESINSRSKTIIIRDPNRSDNRAVLGTSKWETSNRRLPRINVPGHIISKQERHALHRDMRLQYPAYSSSSLKGTPSMVKKILSPHSLSSVRDISTLVINKERRTATSTHSRPKTPPLSTNPQFVDINSVKDNPTQMHSFDDYSQQKSLSSSDPQRSFTRTVMPDSDISGTSEPVPTQLFVNNLELDKRRLTLGLDGQRKPSTSNQASLSPPDLEDSSYGSLVQSDTSAAFEEPSNYVIDLAEDVQVKAEPVDTASEYEYVVVNTMPVEDQTTTPDTDCMKSWPIPHSSEHEAFLFLEALSNRSFKEKEHSHNSSSRTEHLFDSLSQTEHSHERPSRTEHSHESSSRTEHSHESSSRTEHSHESSSRAEHLYESLSQTEHSYSSQRFKCALCSYMAVKQCNLTRHMKNVHKLGQKFGCPACFMFYRDKHSLREHMIEKHDLPEELITNAMQPISNQKVSSSKQKR